MTSRFRESWFPTLEHGFEEANETTEGSVLRRILTHTSKHTENFKAKVKGSRSSERNCHWESTHEISMPYHLHFKRYSQG